MRIFCLFYLITFISFGQKTVSLRIPLEEIYKENLSLRKNVMPTVQQYGFESPQMDSLDRKITHFDSASLVYVKKILDKYGWVGKSKIGEMANQAIYTTIQHSPNPDDRVQYFPLLQESCEIGESQKSDMATMYDRIQIESSKNQLYGTQSRMVEGQLELYPIEDAQNVNKRRKNVGLRKLKF